jgi:exodeoxyribonuclease V alpha subunit
VNEADTLFEIFEGTYSGTVEVLESVYKDDDDGYAVLDVRNTESGDEFSLVGPVGHLNPGDRADVSGEWKKHSRYGLQLQAEKALPIDPPDRKGQIAYLSSLRNIGPSRAEALVDEYGDEVLRTIASDPAEVFGSLKGMSTKQAEKAAESWYSSRTIRDLHIQLAPHGLAHFAAQLRSRYGDSAMSILHEDPYRLTEVDGIGFIRADKIALATDVPQGSDRRAQAAAVYTLAEAEQQGHTYLPIEELADRVGEMIGFAAEYDVIASARGLLIDQQRVYRKSTHACEIHVAEELASRAFASPHLEHRPPEKPPESDDGLTEEQWAAVRSAFESRLSVLTGGPGVGKTVCTKAIVSEADFAEVEIALCAPTGRAARRLEEATGHEAHTIHRMLEWSPGREPGFNPEHPLPAEMIIVDECSMLNLRLMEALLGGLAESTHIVFVGDSDQLPPIGAGKPFEDLIDSGVVPVVRLSHIFRQAARSMITTAAHEINEGRVPHLRPTEDQDHDFFFIDRPNPERAVDTVVEIVSERVPDRYGLDPIRDVQVLAPIYKGPIGIDVLNERLRSELNPDGKHALNQRFRIGDRLIQTKNSHELGLMNGSIVFLREDHPEDASILVDTDDGSTLVIPYDETRTLQPAYAISIHKAQGCEVPIVVSVCHRSHARMLTRPLLYTAITRARSSCVLVGDPFALKMAVRRDGGARRYSGLAERLND